jgi:hypothetical protein
VSLVQEGSKMGTVEVKILLFSIYSWHTYDLDPLLLYITSLFPIYSVPFLIQRRVLLPSQCSDIINLNLS